MSHQKPWEDPVKREEGARVKFDNFQVFEELFHRNGDSFSDSLRGRKNLNATNIGFLPGMVSTGRLRLDG